MTAKTDTKPRKPLVVAVLSTGIRVSSAELRGVERAAARAGWTLETVDPAQTGPDMAPFAPLFARADGVIVRENLHLENAAALLPPETPVVQLDGIHPRADARVRSDVGAETDLAVQELLSLGRRSYVFVPMPKARRWTAKRGELFRAKIRAAGRDAFLYEPQTEWGWAKERDALAKWLSLLPRPIAAFAGNDFLAKFTLDACRDAGLDVPGDVAILGADDDETLCLSTRPTLSSIRVDFEGAGRMAAELLAKLMDRRRASRRNGPSRKGKSRIPTVLYGPLGIARRGSTRRGEPGTDPRLAAGMDFIASHFDNPFLGVRDVAAVMGTNVRQAARLFLPTGRTIREHVEEKRLERVRHLLETTALPLAAIAETCGFASRQYLSLVFRRRTGQTPGEWRRAEHGGG
ncbi:MAG: substrate-binding domain-containing protein [Kiritimatiellae bacterium]|nr:substrate-binding domain-containing protein [Kiritimatiellia bacterium]